MVKYNITQKEYGLQTGGRGVQVGAWSCVVATERSRACLKSSLSCLSPAPAASASSRVADAVWGGGGEPQGS